MKRILLALLLVAFVVTPIYSGMNPYATNTEGTVAYECGATGTYTVAWDGDHPSGEEYACVSGDTAILGAQTGGTLTTGGYVITAQDQFITWTTALLNDETGTFWIELTVNTGDGPSSQAIVFGSYNDGDNYILTKCETDLDGEIETKGDGTPEAQNGSLHGVRDTATWYRFAWTTATQKISVKVGAENNQESTSTTHTAWHATKQPDDIYIGDLIHSYDWTGEITITRWALVNGTYEAANPF